MSAEIIVIYATDWCGDCRRARRFFDRHAIAYRWINIDHDTEGERFVLATNHGNRSVPTILLPGGEILVEPGDQLLADSIAKEKS